MDRQRVFSGAPWEQTFGYCRALRVGAQIVVSGTAPVGDDGATFAPGDAYAQARRCFEIAGRALTELGGQWADVVRTRMFVTDIAQAAAFGRAHAERFAGAPPVTTMVEVRALIASDMLIEIELEAWLR
jgi:enamine deaminase RidA (YjgF/YER057c/UK114 family)